MSYLLLKGRIRNQKIGCPLEVVDFLSPSRVGIAFAWHEFLGISLSSRHFRTLADQTFLSVTAQVGPTSKCLRCNTTKDWWKMVGFVMNRLVWSPLIVDNAELSADNSRRFGVLSAETEENIFISIKWFIEFGLQFKISEVMRKWNLSFLQ